MDERRAVVLEAEGVRGHDHKLMAIDFTSQQNLRPALKNAVFHGILSFYPGEKVSDEKMVEIAKEYLQEMGIVNTQYIITKHTDKNHPHLHILANLVNNEGKVIKDSWIGLKGKKVSQKLTLKHGLTPALTKNLVLTNLENMNEKEGKRYVIYQAISEALPQCKNLNELKNILDKRGIETLYKYKGQTEELQGISFKIGEYKFKGSSIDRNFSLKGLERTIQANRFRQQLLPATQHLEHRRLSPKEEKVFSHLANVQALKVLTDLVKPTQSFEQIPAELKKKKKKKYHGL
jgi:hypothetical protein